MQTAGTGRVVASLLLLLSAAGCAAKPDQVGDNKVRFTDDQSLDAPYDTRVMIDGYTGCQYIVTAFGTGGTPSVTPQLAANGEQICSIKNRVRGDK